MKLRVTIWLVSLSVALAACAFFALRTRKQKPIATDVFLMLASLLPPMLGNLLIIASNVSRTVSFSEGHPDVRCDSRS